MDIGVHVELLSAHQPCQGAAILAEDVGANGVEPSEQFLVVSFLNNSDLVRVEAEVAVRTGVGAGKDVAAHYAHVVGVADETGEGLHRRAGEEVGIGAFDGRRAAHRHLAAEVEPAGAQQRADGRKALEAHRPHDAAFRDRAHMAYLHAHVACGMPAFKDMENDALELGERGDRAVCRVEAYVDAAFGEEVQGVGAGLDVRHAVAERELRAGREGSGVEGGYEDGPGLHRRVGDDAVRPLEDERPEAAFEDGSFHRCGIEFPGVLRAEFEILLPDVRLDEYGEELALFPAHNLPDCSADRRRDENLRILLVGQDRGAAEDGIALLDEQTRDQSREVCRADCYYVRRNCFGDTEFGCTRYREAEPFGQNDFVGHRFRLYSD